MPSRHSQLLEPDQPKTRQVLARIRADIVAGRYSPGYRLPTFSEMEDQYAVGRAVIQNAVETLKRDGFIRSERRRGLFVTGNPPHLFNYGLVLPATPGDAGWGQMMTAMQNEALRIEQNDPDRRFCFFYGVGDRESAQRSLKQLREDVLSHRVAGLVIDHQSAELVNEVLQDAPKVPRVYLWADKTSTVTPCLTVDGPELFRRALRYLKDNERRRVAAVHMGGTNTDFDHAAMFAEVGLEYRQPWTQWIGRSDPQHAEQLVHLLMDYPADSRPDGLVVTDDNLVPYVSSGLIRAGVKVDRELTLVAHCNWPWPPASVLSTVRIGFDLREVMQRAVATLEMQRKAKTPPAYQRILPQFEWETVKQS